MGFGAGSVTSDSADYDVFRRGVAVAFVDVLFDARKLDSVDGLALAQRGQREFAALEAMHLAAMKASGASDRDAQFAALVVRDGGCVLCGRDPSRCEAHHIDPYGSAKQGKTDVDEMALVCKSCHPWLHDSKRTLIWQHAPPNRGPNNDSDDDGDADGGESSTGAYKKGARRVWSTRPATPDEIAPTKPKPRPNAPRARSTRRARAA